MRTENTTGWAAILYADGSRVCVDPDNGATFTLSELQRAVGGYIEIVQLPGTGYDMVLVVNEDGKRVGLPPNETATMLADVHGGIGPMDCIVGDALFCKSSMIK